MGRGTDRPASGARGHGYCARVDSVFELQLKQQSLNYTCPLPRPPSASLGSLAVCGAPAVSVCLCHLAFLLSFVFCLLYFLVSHAFCDRARGCLRLQEIADNLQQL